MIEPAELEALANRSAVRLLAAPHIERPDQLRIATEDLDGADLHLFLALVVSRLCRIVDAGVRDAGAFDSYLATYLDALGEEHS